MTRISYEPCACDRSADAPPSRRKLGARSAMRGEAIKLASCELAVGAQKIPPYVCLPGGWGQAALFLCSRRALGGARLVAEPCPSGSIVERPKTTVMERASLFRPSV